MKRRRKPVDKSDRTGPTPETLAKLQPDALIQLTNRGEITADDERAGREIAGLHRAFKRALFRTSSHDGRGARGLVDVPDCISASEADKISRRYKPFMCRASRHIVARWPKRLSQLDLVLGVCEGNIPLREYAQLYEFTDATMLRALTRGLRDYLKRI